jgi:hypothetical protein
MAHKKRPTLPKKNKTSTMGLKEIFLGDSERYNYMQMCIPQIPWRKTDAKLNFYTRGKGGIIMAVSNVWSLSVITAGDV